MARALALAIWLAAASVAGSARHGDYSIARMPQYDGEYEAPEPPAYDERARPSHVHEDDVLDALAGKSDQAPETEDRKDVDETDTWQRPRKKSKKSSRAVGDHLPDPFDNFDPADDFPKAKSSNRFSKHRPRLKSRRYEHSDEEMLGKSVGRNRPRNDEETDEFSHKNDFNTLDEKSRYSHRERIILRKPRDKFMKRRSESDSLDNVESDMERWMKARDGLGRAPGPPLLSDVEEPPPRRRPTVALRDPPSILEEDEDAAAPIKSKKGKAYEEYSDFYDMKRVMNIKNKLPSLLRRTTVREEVTLEPTRSLHEILSNRRLFLPPAPSMRTALPLEESTSTVTTSTSTTTSTTTLSTLVIQNTTSNSSELSLAEKSRLSILKKAQRKESLKSGPSTKKPPVLLQVTQKVPTVVMVEPPSSEPFLRARDVFSDSPERLDRVKRLMRHKLVANAKNIHDLTDNWDDLVCDYIDMSLLDNSSGLKVRNSVCITALLPLITIVIR